jgi:hypothetical protein
MEKGKEGKVGKEGKEGKEGRASQVASPASDSDSFRLSNSFIHDSFLPRKAVNVLHPVTNMMTSLSTVSATASSTVSATALSIVSAIASCTGECFPVLLSFVLLSACILSNDLYFFCCFPLVLDCSFYYSYSYEFSYVIDDIPSAEPSSGPSLEIDAARTTIHFIGIHPDDHHDESGSKNITIDDGSSGDDDGSSGDSTDVTVDVLNLTSTTPDNNVTTVTTTATIPMENITESLNVTATESATETSED